MNFSSNTDSFNKYGFIRRNTYFKVKHPPLCKSIFTVKSMVCAKCKQLCFVFFFAEFGKQFIFRGKVLGDEIIKKHENIW